MIQGLEFLQKMNLFCGLSLEEITTILKLCRYQRYQKGECIAREGEECLAFGIIESGSVTIVKNNVAGESQILAKMHRGQIFGEILVYSSRKKWPATIWAKENCGIYFMDLNKILNLDKKCVHCHSRLMQNFLTEISDKALFLNKKLEYLNLKKMRAKISKYLLEQAAGRENHYFSIAFNRKEMADFLSVSRTSMSREMQRMKAEGILDFHKNNFKILKKKALEDAQNN